MPATLLSSISPLPTSPTSLFSKLPIELKARVVAFLPATDVTNLRLTCQAWGGVCVEGLFNVRRGGSIQQGVFSIRPHLDDMGRLRQVSGHPWLAKAIKHIHIYTGDLDMLEFDHEAEKVNIFTGLETKLESDLRVDKLFENIIQNRSRHCDPVVLFHSLSKLPAVTSLSATSTECPFPESDTNFTLAWKGLLQRRNLELDTFYDSYDTTSPTRSSIRHICILLAARQLQKPLQRLVLDSFPADLFVREDLAFDSEDDEDEDDPNMPFGIHTNFLHDMQDLTSQVQDFRLGLNITEHCGIRRHQSIARALSTRLFLGSMQNLRNLDITWDMSSRFPHDALDSIRQDCLYSNTFPCLQKLRLSKVRSFDTSFYDFLSRHKDTLKCLSLGHDFFLIPHVKPKGCVSFKSVLSRLRKILDLERFQLLVSATDRKIYDDEWQPLHMEEGDGLPDAKLFEMFVLGKWAWPMANHDSPHWRKLDEWKGWVRRDGWDKLKSKNDVRCL